MDVNGSEIIGRVRKEKVIKTSAGGLRGGNPTNKTVDHGMGENGESNAQSETPKTPIRIVYEAQAKVIQSQLGSLSAVQVSLGLSGRKICQLLLIDPSAWSRWMKNGQNPPPSVWRALQWYMALQEKIPGLTPSYFVGRDSRVDTDVFERRMKELERKLRGTQRLLRACILLCGLLILAVVIGLRFAR